jgi:hypothetical protein
LTLFAKAMIALEVRLNGKQVCIAGAEDLAVLTTNVTAVGKLGKKTVPLRPDETGGEIHYSVGGLTSRPEPEKDVHLRWKSVVPLQVGDVIQVRILETEKADRASSWQKAKRRTGAPSRFRQRHSKRNEPQRIILA